MIYREHFWEHPGLDRLPVLVAVAVYDAGVNMGMPRAVKHLQECCNALGGERIAVDGRLGPRTVARVTAACSGPDSQRTFCGKLVERRTAYYHTITANNPKLAVFLNGWLRRTGALWEYLYGLIATGAV